MSVKRKTMSASEMGMDDDCDEDSASTTTDKSRASYPHRRIVLVKSLSYENLPRDCALSTHGVDPEFLEKRI